MLVWEKGVNLVSITFLNFKLVFLTNFLKALFVAERNSADNFSIGIQFCFSSLRCSSMFELYIREGGYERYLIYECTEC